MSGREGEDVGHQPFQVLRLASEQDVSVCIVPVKEGADADGVPCGNPFVCGAVVDDKGKFRVKGCEHPGSHLFIEEQQDFAVAVALKVPAFLDEVFLYPAEPVDFPVADKEVPVQGKGLHAGFGQPHDGQALESHESSPDAEDALGVRSP